MTKNTIILFLISLVSLSVLGQTKTDIEKSKLLGKVKSVHTYTVEYNTKTDTLFLNKEIYSEKGMLLKYYNFTEHTRFDSIVNTYDTQNRKTSKIEFKRTGRFGSIGKEKIIDTIYYQYNSTCKEPIVIKTPNSTYKVSKQLDKNCNILSETELNNGKETTTLFELDAKGRITKKTFTNSGKKADFYETFEYNDVNLTVTNTQHSSQQSIIYFKEITQYNANKKVIQVTTFKQETANASTLKSPNTAPNLHKKVTYIYDAKDNLLNEIYFDENNNEIFKIESTYNDKAELIEQKRFKAGKLEFTKEYKYKNGKTTQEKKVLPNTTAPEYIKTYNYNNNGQLTELIQLVDGDKYTNQYIYDRFNNEIENKEFENDKLIKTKHTKIEYYP